MNRLEVEKASNSLFSKGFTQVKAIQIIEEHRKTRYVTDPVGLSNVKDGVDISRFAVAVPMKKVKTGVKVKDSRGHITSCAIYEKIEVEDPQE